MRISIFTFAFAILLVGSISLFSQNQKVKLTCIAFYNTENLFDTIDQPGVDDIEFTPNGINQYNGERYRTKLQNISTVISQIGDEYQLGGPVIIGLSEIENYGVLNDLVKTSKLAPLNYGIVHHDGPDLRGVDVGLLYRKERFVVINSVSARLYMADTNFKTRDQLVVSGLLDGEFIHIIVNHWPSRRGGEKLSSPKREAAADLCRHLSDSINAIYPNAKIIIMGDLNDDPTDNSLVKNLKAKPNPNGLKSNDLYNPMYNMYKKQGLGSLGYGDSWNLFDQTIISVGLVNAAKGYKFYSANIFNRPFLLQKTGDFKGYPFRTYVGNNFMGGYSDHLPVYVYLIKE